MIPTNVLLLHQVLVIATVMFLQLMRIPVEGGITNNLVDTDEDEVHKLVKKWAPLVLLAPGERFLPSSVSYFLEHMLPSDPTDNNRNIMTEELPYGHLSENYHLTTRKPVEQLLLNSSSFLFGQNPQQHRVPVYTIISRCLNHYNYNSWMKNAINYETPNTRIFHVTYWFFYPFNEGKNVCTLSLGFLGPVPIPKMFNKCLGEQHNIGSHVGDWEHMSLYFENSDTPENMYVSTHDAGVYYKYDSILNGFVYERQETRRGILQKPKFPNKVYLLHGHPLLYSAKGSHGLWSKPGKHRYLTVPRMHDETGNGISWRTWDSLEIIDPPFSVIPRWMKYRGKWGNAKSYCHPLKRVGINICQLSDGPTGIPLKRLNFICPKKK